MDSFIEEKLLAGNLDSQGSFSVDSLAAIRKTLTSALPEPHYYLFQIAQGLVAARASSIEVAIGRESVVLDFLDTQQVFSDLAGAQKRLFKGLTLSSASPLDLLLTGLATAVGQEMDRADLYIKGSTSCLQITSEKASLVELKHPSASARVELHRAASRGLSFAWTRIWGAMGDEGELQQRFEFCHPPLKIGGLPTSPTPSWRAEVPLCAAVGRLLLLEAAVIDNSLPSHQISSFHNTKNIEPAKIRSLLARAFDSSGKVLDINPLSDEWLSRRWSVFACPASWPLAKIWWIRNGMTVEQTTSDLGFPGLLVLAPADELDLDASGYRLVKNKNYDKACEKAAEITRLALTGTARKEAEDALNQLEISPLEQSRAPQEGQDFKDLLAHATWLK